MADSVQSEGCIDKQVGALAAGVDGVRSLAARHSWSIWSAGERLGAFCAQANVAICSSEQDAILHPEAAKDVVPKIESTTIHSAGKTADDAGVNLESNGNDSESGQGAEEWDRNAIGSLGYPNWIELELLLDCQVMLHYGF